MAKFTLHRKPRKAGNFIVGGQHVVFDIQNIKKETTHMSLYSTPSPKNVLS